MSLISTKVRHKILFEDVKAGDIVYYVYFDDKLSEPRIGNYLVKLVEPNIDGKNLTITVSNLASKFSWLDGSIDFTVPKHTRFRKTSSSTDFHTISYLFASYPSIKELDMIVKVFR